MTTTGTPSSTRILVWIGAGIVALLVLVWVTVAIRNPAEFEPGSPEAIVQIYVQSVLDGDSDTAWALLTPALQRRCDVDDLEDRYRGRSGNVVLVDTDVQDDTARVELEFTASYGDDPFDVSDYSYGERFQLRLIDDEWRISAAPWPLYRCSEV